MIQIEKVSEIQPWTVWHLKELVPQAITAISGWSSSKTLWFHCFLILGSERQEMSEHVREPPCVSSFYHHSDRTSNKKQLQGGTASFQLEGTESIMTGEAWEQEDTVTQQLQSGSREQTGSVPGLQSLKIHYKWPTSSSRLHPWRFQDVLNSATIQTTLWMHYHIVDALTFPQNKQNVNFVI